MIAIFDVFYEETRANAVCVLAKNWYDAKPTEVIKETCPAGAPYISGRFWLRELPCILAVLKKIETPEYAIVDGYAVLPDGKSGLGAILRNALKIPVIGVAKTAFTGSRESKYVTPTYRGVSSTTPLYVTSVGIPHKEASMLIKSMAGTSKLPDLIKLADKESRVF
jgi:deoxyribonuclease V